MTDDLEARRERNIRERANRPYFKRVLEDMQSGYQPDQTSSNSIYLRPRVSVTPPGYQNLDDYTFDSFGHIIQNKVRINSIITRLRIWVRRIERRLNHSVQPIFGNHYGGFGRNLIGRSGWDVTMLLRQPTSYGEQLIAGRQFNHHGRFSSAVYGRNNTVWKKNQRARLF